MKGNMSYTMVLSFETIDTIKALKRFSGINAKQLMTLALEAYMKQQDIEISIDEDTVWIWSMDKPDAGFMTRADEKWHDAEFEWQEDEQWVREKFSENEWY